MSLKMQDVSCVCVVVYSCDLSTWEADTRKSGVQGQLWLHTEFKASLIAKKKKIKSYKNVRIFQLTTPPAPDITGMQLPALLGRWGDGCLQTLGVCCG